MRKFGKLITMVAAAAMLFQTTAMAAPIDELNEIMAAQAELQQETLLSRTLGLAEMKEAIQKNGIEVDWRGGLTEETAAALMMEDEIPQGAYAELGFAVDLNAENWIFEAGFGAEESALGNLALYGDRDRLSVAIPQLFAGALALQGGNLKEQYTGSALSTLVASMAEKDISMYIPELNLRFYPEPSDMNLVKGFMSSFEEAILQEVQNIESQVRVEKKGNSEEMLYTMTMPTEVIQDVYASFFEAYLGIFSQLGLVEAYEIYEVEDQLDVMIETMFSIMPEDITVDFHTKDNLLEKISYEIYMDTGAIAQLEEELSYQTQSSDEMETILTEVVEGVLDEAGIVIDDVEVEAEDFKGTVAYEIIYLDPSNPSAGMDMHMNMTDDEKGEFADFYMQMATVEEGTVSTSTMSMDMSVQGQHVYGGTLYTMTFDAATGDLDMVIALAEDPESPMADEMDMEELPVITLDSTFTEIEPGKAFTWTMDGLTMKVDGETIGVTTEVSVTGEPEAIAVPGQERVLLEMTEDEIMNLLMEVMMNAQTWVSQFEEDEAAEDYNSSEEIPGAEANAVSIIGGADGPTSIFVAGKVS